MDMLRALLSLLILSSLTTAVLGVCYFPVEYQGIFSTQSTLSGDGTHKYSQITILPDAIPVWGVCHEMIGTNVILHDATGGQECFRCFHVTLHSPNVIQVYTEGLDKCYMNAGAARASCPSTADIKSRVAREIMLYKSRSFTRDGKIDRVMCPFSAKFHFTYDVNDGTENAVECPDSKSTISNCPKGSELDLRFTQCRFRDTNMVLRCLGDWTGIDGYQYFALWDTRVTSDDQPQYRCAMYHIDEDTGRVFIGFSVDATCTNRLHSPWDGYETMVLTPAKRPSPPAPVHSHSCIFPQWANGKWKDIQIRGRELWWKDLDRDKFYHTLCLTQNAPSGERYALYSVNQCGVEEFTCIWIKSRDLDVMEFKIATVQYNYFNSTRICADDVFVGQKWHTQGRIRNSLQKDCPVLGEYTGVIPDNPELCARLASDCKDPALMHYTVSSCSNSTQVFETYGARYKRGTYRRENPLKIVLRRHHRRSGTQPPRYHHRTRGTSYTSPPYREPSSSSRGVTSRSKRRHSSFRGGSDPSYVFPVASSPERQVPSSTRLPYIHEEPFYYYIDQYGNRIRDIPTTVILAEREYQCLGQWKESGVMYTFTYRLDVSTYECFAGVVIDENEAFIIEAGVSCERGLQPLAKGMKLVKQGTCNDTFTDTFKPSVPPEETIVTPSKPSLPAWWPSTSRKPWLKKSTTTTQKPLWKNEKPREKQNSSNQRVPNCILLSLLCLLTYLLQS